MTSKEFNEIRKQFYFEDYESILNIISLHCYSKYEKYMKQGKEALALNYKEDFNKINEILTNRGFWNIYNN